MNASTYIGRRETDIPLGKTEQVAAISLDVKVQQKEPPGMQFQLICTSLKPSYYSYYRQNLLTPKALCYGFCVPDPPAIIL